MNDEVVLLEDKIAEIKERQKNRPAFRLSTGLSPLDECLDGFRKGQIVVISGAPKAGKTQVGLAFTKQFVEEGHKVMWFEFEVHEEEFVEKIPPSVIGKFQVYMPKKLPSRGPMRWVEQKIIEGKKQGVEAVFIDNVDFLKEPDLSRQGQGNMAEYLDSIYTHLKNIAREHELILFIFHHIRKTEWKSGNLPTSEELKNGGAPVALGDIIMMVMRRLNPDKEADSNYDGSRAVIGIQENRLNGRTKKIAVNFDEVERVYREEVWVEQPKVKKTFYS